MDERRRLLRRVREAARRRHDAEASWLDAIGEARAAGLSLAAIAEEAGVTRGRIHQLTTGAQVEQDASSGRWYVLGPDGERRHGPYLERPTWGVEA